MKFTRKGARFFVPDGKVNPLGRITHLGIGAHQDDLEFMAFHGILHCYGSDEEWFGGVTCTDGSGSARHGSYADCTDEEMRKVRMQEQETAATLGRYAAMIQLDFASSAVQGPNNTALKEDLMQIMEKARPRVVYTHNPADKHDTHVAVVIAALQAMRELPEQWRPREVYGCEVWRGLDWMQDEDKVLLDVSADRDLAAALNGVFESQIAGGKRYDLAILGRRRANATFFRSHEVDRAEMISLAMDLTPLVADPSIDIIEHVASYISRFEFDVRTKLTSLLGKI